MKITLVAILSLPFGLPNCFAADAPRNNPQPSSTSSNEGLLILENDSTLSWRASAGRAVSIKAPQLTLTIPGDNIRVPFNVKLRKHSFQKGEAVLEYELSLNQGGHTITGSGTLKVSRSDKSPEDVLLVHTAYTFDEAVTADVETVCGFDVQGEPARQMGLPERNGYFKWYPILPTVGGAGRFDLGNAAKGPVQCSTLGMPVVGLSFGDNDQQLAIAADPYCGSFFQAESITSATRVTVRTTYMGSVAPVRSERRTLALEFHRNGTDGTLRNFYRTIPEIDPGAPWTQGIHLVYYDRNPDLVFLGSDVGRASYALVANGTYQDSAMREEDWGPSMFVNYRNCLWSCNWYPLQYARRNQIAAEKYGLPQGVSNGWEDNCGPSRMPSALLDDVLRRFTKNVESKRERLRYLTP